MLIQFTVHSSLLTVFGVWLVVELIGYKMRLMAKLVVIGTPIGNLEDISFRALKRLDEVETLICEDYRQRGWLKNKPKLVAYNDYNAKLKLERVRALIREESLTGLVSDAGMPLISDPGYRLIRFCYDEEIEVEIVPGPSAVIEAVVASGFGGDRFMFNGFLPKKPGKLRKHLERLKSIWEIDQELRLVIFISPHRLERELMIMKDVFGGQTLAVLLREMTKKFEERLESNLTNLVDLVKGKKIKGEMVLILRQAV